MTANPRHELFREAAEEYARHRPQYPDALLARIEALAGLGRGAWVLDLGAGTGISSRAWAGRGHRVVALEPNDAMLVRGRQARAVRGAAEALPFVAGSFDLVVAHQALHWFELAPTLAECERVGRRGGWAAAVWNTRSAEGLAGDYEGVVARFSDRYRASPKADTRGALERALGARLLVLEHDWCDRVDRATFLGRARSASYVTRGVADREGLEAELARVFAGRARDGRAELAYRTTALCWRL